MKINSKKFSLCCQKIKSKRPLVHNITNYVVMEQSANALLAIGASPIMAHAIEEVQDITKLANSLVINIGTLSSPWIKSMFKACVVAKKNNKPIILDPVGAGATQFRTKTACTLIDNNYPDVIRGNGSEIAAIMGQQFSTHGVDSTISSEFIVDVAENFAKENGIIICISGEQDYITDGNQTVKISNGNEILSRVTGMGCVASCLVGAFAASNKNLFNSTIGAMATMGICGERAAKLARGTGSFQIHFLDVLSNFSPQDIEKEIRLEYV